MAPPCRELRYSRGIQSTGCCEHRATVKLPCETARLSPDLPSEKLRRPGSEIAADAQIPASGEAFTLPALPYVHLGAQPALHKLPGLCDPVQGAINASTQGQAEEYSYNIWPSQARMKFRRQML